MCDTRNDACSLFTAQASLSIVRMNAIYALNLDLKNLLTIRFLSHRSFFSHSRGIASKMPAHSDMNKSHSLLYGFIFFVFWFWANGWFIALQNWKPITNFRFRLNPSCVFFSSSSSHLPLSYPIGKESEKNHAQWTSNDTSNSNSNSNTNNHCPSNSEKGSNFIFIPTVEGNISKALEISSRWN